MKCIRCGVVNLEEFNFCHNCGKQVQVKELIQNETEKSNEKKVEKKVQTFDQFRKRLSSQRQEQINTNKKAKKNKAVASTEVMISVGLMKLVNGVFKPVKGKAMMVRVLSDIRKVPLLSKALDKHSAHDRNFDPSEDYTLAYPDGTEVLTLPGQPAQIFQLDKYKEDIGKSFNRITLYLVQRDLLNNDGENESDDCEFNSESVQSVAAEEPCTSAASATSNTSKDILLQSAYTNSQSVSSPQNASGSQSHSRHSTSSSYASGSFSSYISLVEEDAILSDDEKDSSVAHDEFSTNEEASSVIPLVQILQNIKDDMQSGDYGISLVNVRRSAILEDSCRLIGKKKFNPRARLSVRFADDDGYSEGAVDAGGPRREYLRLLVKSVNEHFGIFVGPAQCRTLFPNYAARRYDHYRTAGLMIAWSIAHGGPAGNFFCSSLYNTIAYGYTMEP